MAWLRQKLFGSSSERRADPVPGQMGLFDPEEEKPAPWDESVMGLSCPVHHPWQKPHPMMPECPATSGNSGTLKQFCCAISMTSGVNYISLMLLQDDSLAFSTK